MNTISRSTSIGKLILLLSLIGAIILLTACGAQAQGSGQSSVTLGPVSFAKDVLPIMQTRCVKCHGGENTNRGLDLKSYSGLMAGSINGSVIVAGDPTSSKLFQLVDQGRMPKSGGKLSADQIAILKKWIQDGAQNN